MSSPLNSLDTWTDDLQCDGCFDQSTGHAINKLYSSTSPSSSLHDYLHKSFGVRLPSGGYLWGLLTGFNNAEAVRYFATHLPLVMSDPAKKCTLVTSSSSFEEIFFSNALKDSFRVAEETFQKENENRLNEKLILDIQLKENETLKSDPELVDKLNQIEKDLSSGTSAAVVLLHNGRLFVSNIGDTKVLLCRKVLNNQGGYYLRCVELTSQHTLDNNAERKRLQAAGLEIDDIEDIGGTRLTRCLGYLLMKSFYNNYFPNATMEIMLSKPEIESIAIDDGGQFLLLASDSLVRALMEADPSLKTVDLAQSTLIQWVADELETGDDVQAKLKEIPQTIIDRIARMHEECFASTKKFRQIEDITLVMRLLKEASPRAPQIEVTDVSEKFEQLQLNIDTSDEVHDLEGHGIPVQYEPTLRYIMPDLEIGIHYRSNTNDTVNDDDRTIVPVNMTNTTEPLTPTNSDNPWTFDFSEHMSRRYDSLNSNTSMSPNQHPNSTSPSATPKAYVDFEPLWRVLERRGDPEALERKAKLDKEQK